MLTEWKTGQDTSVSASWTTSSGFHGHAVEIKAAVAASTVTMTLGQNIGF